MTARRPIHPTRAAASLAAGACLLVAALAAAGEARGTLTHKTTTVALAHAYLVKGPDAVDPKKTIRRLILSSKDLGPKLQACQTMSCTDSDLTEGMTVDLDGGPRLNYWMVLGGGRVQHSDTAKPEALKASVNEPGRLAGRLAFDGAPSGGPKVDVEFNAPLMKELKAAR
jgi:hypothetical protein